jgi:hypothetical protein
MFTTNEGRVLARRQNGPAGRRCHLGLFFAAIFWYSFSFWQSVNGSRAIAGFYFQQVNWKLEIGNLKLEIMKMCRSQFFQQIAKKGCIKAGLRPSGNQGQKKHCNPGAGRLWF